MTDALRAILFSALLAACSSLSTHAQSAASAPTAEAIFADASAKEAAVRKALSAPTPPSTVLKAVRTVVVDFETIVRRFPTSAYADDALWRAALLSSDAFRSFGDERDHFSAIRLLQTLGTQYPSSNFSKQGPALITELRLLPVRMTIPAEPAPSVMSTISTPPPRSAVSAGPPAHAAASASSDSRAPVPSKTAPGQIALIRDIRRATLPDIVRVVVELDREVIFHDERLENPSRVFVDLPSTEAVKSLRDQTIRFDGDNDLIRQVRLGRHPNNTTRVVLEAADVTSYSVYPLYNPFRLVIDCLRPAAPEQQATLPPFPPAPPRTTNVGIPARVAAPTPALVLALRRVEPWARALPRGTPGGTARIREALLPEPVPEAPAPLPVTAAVLARLPVTPAPTPPARVPTAAVPSLAVPSRNLAGGFSLARQLGMGVSRIVIDPGHGGRDPGAKGGGTTEAELVLDVALRLEKLLLNSPGVDVVLTRRTDEFVQLQERTAIANRETADLFLSIHANANDASAAHGVETYFLNFATTLSAAAVAARENAASGHSMGELPDVVKTIALNNKIDESKDFATYVQRELVAKLRGSNKTLKDLGVKQAPFQVLIGAAMPSVLAEVSFMTNTQEARLLKQGAYRQKIAEALFDAIRRYQASLTKVSTIAQQP